MSTGTLDSDRAAMLDEFGKQPNESPFKRVVANLKKRRPAVVDIVFVAALWQLSTLFLPPLVAPSLPTVWRSIVSIVTDFHSFNSLLVTVERVVLTLIVSFFFGLGIGILMGAWASFETYARPILYLLQGIPGLSWVVFAVIWFTHVEARIAFIMIVELTPSFALFTLGAVRSVPSDLQDVARAFRSSNTQRFRLIVWPSIIPAMLSAWEVNLGTAVRVVVVAELVGATTGVGYQLLNSQAVYDMSGALAWTILLVTSLLVFQGIRSLIESRVLGWRPVAGGQK